jgi:hypothetical protein
MKDALNRSLENFGLRSSQRDVIFVEMYVSRDKRAIGTLSKIRK